jgi:hypothetical protein
MGTLGGDGVWGKNESAAGLYAHMYEAGKPTTCGRSAGHTSMFTRPH